MKSEILGDVGKLRREMNKGFDNFDPLFLSSRARSCFAGQNGKEITNTLFRSEKFLVNSLPNRKFSLT